MKYLSLITLAFFFSASACTKQETLTGPTTDSLSRSFLALGDSYTIGESVSSQERFPAQTVAILRSQGINVAEPQYIAHTGWTTADLQNAIHQTNLKASYDIVTLLIGVNDQYQGMDTAGYRTRFTQLLQKAIQLSGNKIPHIFVVSIPDYGVTPFGGGSAKTSKEIAEFNAINQQITLAYHVAYVDITPISKQAATEQSLTAGDGLHPSGKQYQLWAMKLATAMTPVLK
jgi:lysophospholipase L1-like esterase